MLAGGCFCGRVRYEIGGAPFNATLCHCSDCRRVAGAPVVAWFAVHKAAFTVVSGSLASFGSSPGVSRGFCRDCGTPLTYARADIADEIDVTTASLDTPNLVPPRDQTFVRERLGWLERADALPHYEGSRPAEG